MQNLTSDQRKLVDGKNFAFVATVNKDGSPQVTPVWIDTEGKTILINTAENRQKNRNLTRDPRVAIAISDQSNPYSKVIISGKVVQRVTGKEAEDHIDKMAKKYLGQDKYPYRQPTEKRVLFKVEPLKVSN